MESLSKIEEQIIIGSILGDGCLVGNKRNPKFKENHSIKQEEYLRWKGDI